MELQGSASACSVGLPDPCLLFLGDKLLMPSLSTRYGSRNVRPCTLGKRDEGIQIQLPAEGNWNRKSAVRTAGSHMETLTRPLLLLNGVLTTQLLSSVYLALC